MLYERGVDGKGFAIIRSQGDRALFKLDTNTLKKRIGAPSNRAAADFLSTIGIKAKDLKGVNPIGKEHVDNNIAVRDMLLQRNIIPEEHAAAEDVKKVEKVERRLKSDERKLKK